MVRLSEILGSAGLQRQPLALTLALGKDIAGKPVVADLARMPHLLVAGTTGSGKSVGINAMILSLLYKADPPQVRLILVDPKMLELSIYEGIPHLLAPVVTDMREAGNALQLVRGGDGAALPADVSKLGVRNLAGYNQKIAEARAKGELVTNPFSLDAGRPRAARSAAAHRRRDRRTRRPDDGRGQEGRGTDRPHRAEGARGRHPPDPRHAAAVGRRDHRPDQGQHSRAHRVPGLARIDSRTILDQMGAESLLGQGDMLYLPPGTGLPQRVHGAFVSDAEVHRVVEYLKIQGRTRSTSRGCSKRRSPAATRAPAAVDRAARPTRYTTRPSQIVLKNRRASISLVQRHLRIGYNRAARLLEDMERGRHGLCHAEQRQPRHPRALARRRLTLTQGSLDAVVTAYRRGSGLGVAGAGARRIDGPAAFFPHPDDERARRVRAARVGARRQGPAGVERDLRLPAARQVPLELRQAVRAADRRRRRAAGALRQGPEPGHRPQARRCAAVEPGVASCSAPTTSKRSSR